MTHHGQATFSEDATEFAVERIDSHWGVFVVLGALMIAAGVAAVLFPFGATLAAELVIGAALLAGGLCQAVQAFSRSRWKGRALTGLSAVLGVATGTLLLAFPLSGIVTLTVVVGAYFLVSGAFRLALALTIRPEDSWGWMALSAAVALVLGVLVIVQLPEIAAWLLGLMVGIDLVVAGWWALLVGFAQRRAQRA